MQPYRAFLIIDSITIPKQMLAAIKTDGDLFVALEGEEDYIEAPNLLSRIKY